MDNIGKYSSALEDFRLARRRAAIQEVLGRISGKSQRLLSFEEMRKRVGQGNVLPRGLKEIELESIVGSVDRYQDFTRNFLPKREIQKERWARIRVLSEGKGLPPIDVYELGNVYFVLDGHHRVSVARQNGAKTIQAQVIEISTRANFSLDDDADALILKAEEIRFMNDTKLNGARMDLQLGFTSASGYKKAREHIAVHQFTMGLEQKREINIQEAAEDWMDTVYVDAIATIRRRGLLRDFPDRSEGDLYLWLMEYRNEVSEEIGWELEAEEAAEDMQERFSLRVPKMLERARTKLVDVLTPDTFESGPRTGKWREARKNDKEGRRLFRRILVAISGEDDSWRALEQALRIAKNEDGNLRGLHVVREGDDAKKLKAVREKFDERVREARVEGRLVVEKGSVRRNIELRSRWSDVAVLPLLHPPEEGVARRLRSGLREVIQRIPRPLLLVPQYSEMQHALLAFDGSRKATEALYIAAYLQKNWGIKLSVLTSHIGNEKKALERQKPVRRYFEQRDIQAEFEICEGRSGEYILKVAQKKACDLLLMGGYGAKPLVEMVVGSSVDRVLREFKGPVLLCR